jgi:hypothetical protein
MLSLRYLLATRVAISIGVGDAMSVRGKRPGVWVLTLKLPIYVWILVLKAK